LYLVDDMRKKKFSDNLIQHKGLVDVKGQCRLE
jgi:hypothetical protein